MATLSEIAAIKSDPLWGSLQNKVRAACVIKAAAILNSATPTTSQVQWADSTLSSPTSSGDKVIYYVIATNSSATIAQIMGAADTAIQANVDDAVDKLIGA